MNYSFPLSQAEKIEFLIDAQAYFSSFAKAAALAREKIVITGWDIHSRTWWKDPETQEKIYLSAWLEKCLKKNPELQIYILCWDFNPFVGRNREWWPFYFPKRWGKRIHFQKGSQSNGRNEDVTPVLFNCQNTLKQGNPFLPTLVPL